MKKLLDILTDSLTQVVLATIGLTIALTTVVSTLSSLTKLEIFAGIIWLLGIVLVLGRLLHKASIPTLTTLSRTALFLALGFAAYYSAEYSPILILPITALIIGYALILIFARESGNVEG